MANIEIVTQPKHGSNFGEAHMSPAEYAATKGSEISAAIAQELGEEPNAVTLNGYNEDREVVFFGLSTLA